MSAMKHSASCKLRNGACESKLSSIKQEIKSVWQEACTTQTTYVTVSVAAPMILFHAAGAASWILCNSILELCNVLPCKAYGRHC